MSGMTELEVAQLLTIASAVDNRTVTPETVRVWHPIVESIDFDLAVQAMQMHFKETDKYLMPVHVTTNARRARDIRAREQRKNRPAIEPEQVTLNRERFEVETAAAIEAARKKREEGEAA